MKSSIRSISTAIGVAAGLAVTTTAFAVNYVASQDVGESADAGAYTRVININPNTKWVNVIHDETVKFVEASSGKSFVWRFNTRSTALDLGAAAGAEFLNGRHVQAYVGLSQDLQGGD